MKKFLSIVGVLALLAMGSIGYSAECPNLTYVPEYDTECIDGYMWMMRVDRIEDCVVYTVPVAQQWKVIRNKYGKILNVVPQACESK